MKRAIRGAMLALTVVGVGLIAYSAEWPAALGAFLLLWAHNIERH